METEQLVFVVGHYKSLTHLRRSCSRDTESARHCRARRTIRQHSVWNPSVATTAAFLPSCHRHVIWRHPLASLQYVQVASREFSLLCIKMSK